MELTSATLQSARDELRPLRLDDRDGGEGVGSPGRHLGGSCRPSGDRADQGRRKSDRRRDPISRLPERTCRRLKPTPSQSLAIQRPKGIVMSANISMASSEPSRRRFIEGLALAGGAAVMARPTWSRAEGTATNPAGLSCETIHLTIGESPLNITGRRRMATAVNGTVPAPILRLRQGQNVTINVANTLREPASIHWHGLRLPNDMDGVPGLTFPGIAPGETFTYRFPILQSGTYFYHSHSGMQEQTGLYGALVLAPPEKEPYDYDREYVIQLSDWTDQDPMKIFSNLKQQSDFYNYHKQTLGD